MCEFCLQHGDGKKWYLAHENYLKRMADSDDRETFIQDFFKNYEKNYRKSVKMVDIALQIPFVREYAEKKVRNYFTQKHAGQVILLEDAIAICGIPGRVSVIDCPCRKMLFNKSEKKCILFGTTAEIVENLPDNLHILDLGHEDAVNLLTSVEKEGEIHTIWTFKTPYIGAICNCRNTECLLFHLKTRYSVPEIIRKGHEIALINESLCDGCGNCQKVCQFRGIVIENHKAKVNHNCHGCGICRRFCPEGAIRLQPF